MRTHLEHAAVQLLSLFAAFWFAYQGLHAYREGSDWKAALGLVLGVCWAVEVPLRNHRIDRSTQ